MGDEDAFRALTDLINACKRAEETFEAADPRPEALLRQVKKTRERAHQLAWDLGVETGVFVASPPPITSVDQFAFFGQPSRSR